jgi:hypothetical protein
MPARGRRAENSVVHGRRTGASIRMSYTYTDRVVLTVSHMAVLMKAAQRFMRSLIALTLAW